jgi:hypothetical protein
MTAAVPYTYPMRKKKDTLVRFLTTDYRRRLLVAIMQRRNFTTETETLERLIEEAAAREKITPMPEEEYVAWRSASGRKVVSGEESSREN